MRTKIFTMLFAILVNIGMTYAAITVRVDPQSLGWWWSGVNLWAWTSTGNMFKSWPGVRLSKDECGWYYYTFAEDVNSVNIVLNSGGTTNVLDPIMQTVDITNITTSTCFALNSYSSTSDIVSVSVVECPHPTPKSGRVKIGDLYYNLDGDNLTASVIYAGSYSNFTTVSIPEEISYTFQTYDVTYTYQVTSIGQRAFQNCNSLTSISIPNGVTSIGDGAFTSCSNLTSISIPNGVTSIGDGAFTSCSSLTSISIPNSVTSIGSAAFVQCTSLSSIIIPNSVTTIGDGAFTFCSNLTSISIPNSVTSIGDGVFGQCTSLSSIIIPNSVTSIGDRAFIECRSLSSIEIPNSVSSIGDYAFQNCIGLADLSLPNSIMTIGQSAFSSCISLSSVVIPGSVTNISNSAFYNCNALKSIEIPQGVTSIGESAFSWCTNLTAVTIPNSVTDIGYGAFLMCDSLNLVEIPNSVTCIGREAFSGNSIKTVHINADAIVNNSEYDEYFDNLSTIFGFVKEYIIGNSVTGIGNHAFYGSRKLASIYIPNSVMAIGNNAFTNCTNLKNVSLNSNAIASKIYTATNNLTTIFGKQVTKYTLGSDITSIGDYAFSNCDLPNIIIPNSVTSIGNYAFYGCHNFTDVLLPNGITSIGYNAFAYCDNLCLLKIGYNVATILDYAFAGCSSLNTIYNYAPTPQMIESSVLYGVDKIACHLIVPEVSLALYQSAQVWEDFFSTDAIEVIELSPKYHVTVSAGIGGNARPNLDNFEVLDSTQIIIKATPDNDYKFVQWSDGDVNLERTIIITQDTVLQAIFELITYDTLNVQIIPEEGGIVKLDGQIAQQKVVESGQTISLFAEPAERYVFDHYEDCNEIITNREYAVLMTESKTIVAVFSDLPAGSYDATIMNAKTVRKILRNGQILILRGDKTYTTDGRLVR